MDGVTDVVGEQLGGLRHTGTIEPSRALLTRWWLACSAYRLAVVMHGSTGLRRALGGLMTAGALVCIGLACRRTALGFESVVHLGSF